MLEWKACRKKASVAVEAEFSDGHKVQGQLDSWTTAEDFTANLLKDRYSWVLMYGYWECHVRYSL